MTDLGAENQSINLCFAVLKLHLYKWRDRASFQFAVEIAEILSGAGGPSSFMTRTTLVPLLLKRWKR